jgi:hypothetical protein
MGRDNAARHLVAGLFLRRKHRWRRYWKPPRWFLLDACA